MSWISGLSPQASKELAMATSIPSGPTVVAVSPTRTVLQVNTASPGKTATPSPPARAGLLVAPGKSSVRS